MARDGTKNLKPVQSKEEAIERGRKGKLASGENRRKRAEEKDRLRLLMSLPVIDGKAKDQLKKLGLDPSLYDNEMLVDVMLWQQALKGDVGAIKYIDERLGKNLQLELKRREVELKERLSEEHPIEQIETPEATLSTEELKALAKNNPL